MSNLLKTRDHGKLIVVGTEFQSFGLPSHIRRCITLDGIVRSYVRDPVIEVTADHTVRYHVSAAPTRVVIAVRGVAALRPYCRISDFGWLWLYSPLCENCELPYTAHARKECLFTSTRWREHVPDYDREDLL